MLRALTGNITTLSVDAIVNAANTHLQHGGGVALAIARAGGPIIQEESDDWIRRHGPLDPDQAAVTSAGAMPARMVVHVAGPRYRPGQDNAELLRQAVTAALTAARDHGSTSLAMPAISAGIYGYPFEEATATIVEAIRRWTIDDDTFDEITAVGFDDLVTAAFQRAIDG